MKVEVESNGTSPQTASRHLRCLDIFALKSKNSTDYVVMAHLSSGMLVEIRLMGEMKR
jgi:hypothetical protein